ncbi:MAG: VC1465 family Xer recombination activation factor [Gallionella sp.]|nr:VC1465 family Xer recombination activation factor [Gallionella sp.]MDD4946483.1 VC1465 family Xer recombination activation factor [Gallionella sp.]
MKRRKFISKTRWIDPQDFRDLRVYSGLDRKQAAKALDVTPRTIQNWETGGSRIPCMAYRMLRILLGQALPGAAWEGWTVRGDALFSPTGRKFDVTWLNYNEGVFAQARLWRQMYASTGCIKTAQTVIPFPDRRQPPAEAAKPLEAQPKRIGGTR